MLNEDNVYKIILGDIAKLVYVKKVKDGKKAVEIEGKRYVVTVRKAGENKYSVCVGDEEFTVTIDTDRKMILVGGVPHNVKIASVPIKKKSLKRKSMLMNQCVFNQNVIIAPITGKIVEVLAKERERVNKGDPILVIESMKTRNTISSPKKGKIRQINIVKGQIVRKGEILIELD